MNKKILHLLIATILAISVFPFVTTRTDSAGHTSVSDTLSRLKTTQSANHTVTFTLASAWNASETVVIDFVNGDGFDTTGFANTEPEDYDIKWGAAEKTIVAQGSCAANSIEITTVDTTNDTFTFTLCPTSTASGANEVIEIQIGTNATTPGNGDDQIENATASGSKILSITGPTAGDSATLAIPIMSEDQVTVSGTVDPSITSSLSSATCSLGTLTTAAVGVCNYYNEVSTNATGGYASTITEDGNLRTTGADVIDDVTDGNIESTVDDEEYGVSSSDSSGTQDIIDWDGTCDGDAGGEPATAIDGTAKSYATNGDPASSEQTYLCHAAGIAGATEAGSYQHIVTHITTGTF
jgi:hypothetical protein